MLPEFKKRIDTLRDILVGAVPSPAGQIEQITYALIYKFMSDIDDRAASLPGGKRTYFTGEYEKYGWHELMAPTLGAHDQLALYREALVSLAKNPGLPDLFQGIYQNAYLPFNDPRVLRLFLKEIDNFKHSTSDDIGDAYEYLLQITGAQGDVGQFRTPRHIIKFIVEAVNPTKKDSVLDPAVGTAGFLIAAYNHVKHHHDGVDDITGLPDKKEKSLSADEKERMNKNYHGFDIDPTMVRTAKVNMYLHGFTTPDIKNHDSLSSEDYWNERYDVILANPPFMTPKGGIKPHDKFGIVANRAEVLFVDYIASHLTPDGRAGIVVPEGIIFQSGKAYRELRKNLVDGGLYAVVSLPSGVFQPYSGVKTSILLLDKKLAKQRDEILFIKIENDGFSLGTQRREKAGSQLPEALQHIDAYKGGIMHHSDISHTVKREEIAKSGDYNLSGDRYKILDISSAHDYPMVELGDEKYFRIESGGTPSSKNEEFWNGNINWVTLVDLPATDRITPITNTLRKITDAGLKGSSAKLLPIGSVLVSSRATIGRIGIARTELATNQGFKNIIVQNDAVIPEYIANVMSQMTDTLKNLATGGTFAEFSKSALEKVRIPLPPIEIQREIVAELDSYQKIIEAAQTIVKTYKPTIEINPEWEIATIGDICDVGSSKRVFEADWKTEGIPFYRAREIVSLARDGFVDNKLYISEEMFDAYSKKYGNPEAGDVMITGVGTLGVTYLVKDTDRFYFKDGNIIWLKNFSENCNSTYLERLFTTDFIKSQIKAQAAGGTVGTYTISAAKNTTIPLPPLETQREIVAELEAERQLIDANKKLISIYQQKIKAKIAEVWGE